MPKIDFYILSDPAPDAALRYACRLADKAVEQGHRVFVRAASADEAQRLDDLLWTFGDRAFLPHEIASAAAPSHPLVRVLVGCEIPPTTFRDVLINLGTDAVNEIDDLQRIAEVVSPNRKPAARERFKMYRDHGAEPTTHNV